MKGAGLSFMIECLTSLLLSEPRVAPDLETGRLATIRSSTAR